ncbi:MAG: glycine--tRNA ligase subunit beta [Endomicrobium sp.]|jgi:glycyl-tRNA synthetase beta chain|nr:glycine--tRNA ligase subunit beta [Endomicrobium sp.]
MTKKDKKNALLEIGTEEIPFSYIGPALKQIENFASKIFSTYGLKYGTLKTYATPRRFVLIVENIAEKSDDRIKELLGPSLKVAQDAQGKYTQAAECFALKNGGTLEELVIKTTEKGKYLSFIKKTKGEKTEELLSTIFPEIIKNMSFPKTMMWEESGFRFARPIRNIIALYGKKIIKFRIADVDSSNWTIGLHTCDNSKIKIDLPENYLLKMKNKSVIVDQKERREEVKKSMECVVENIGIVVPNEELVDEINYLVEYPSAVLCTFDKKYLALPAEVLTVCMKKSQKCFAVNDKNGKFSNYFIGIKNGASQYQEIAKEGYEKVVAARLADAEFFYHNDLKKGLITNIEKLKGIIFHKEIGTVYEKVERVKQIAELFNKEFNMQVDGITLEKAIMFSKADLVSEMVFEYPELQGIMGKIYALKLGESLDIALSVEQHYWPLSASGHLPSNKVAFLISLSDKIDTLAANFSIGIEPSGSADPYGLRRAGIGFVRMVMENLPDQDVGVAIEKVFEFLPESVKNNSKSKNAYERLLNFFWQRIENLLETEGYNSYEVKAVTNASRVNKLKALGTLQPKLNALRNAKQKGDFLSIAAVFKRISNIINQAQKQNINISQVINEDLLTDSTEKTFYTIVKKVKIEVENCVSKREYIKVFDKVLELKLAIDNFFEKVMIMAEDEAVKINRISLLNYIKNIFAEFIDFSALQYTQS